MFACQRVFANFDVNTLLPEGSETHYCPTRQYVVLHTEKLELVSFLLSSLSLTRNISVFIGSFLESGLTSDFAVTFFMVKTFAHCLTSAIRRKTQFCLHVDLKGRAHVCGEARVTECSDQTSGEAFSWRNALADAAYFCHI